MSAHYTETNRANWDDRAALHAAAETGYAIERYVDDRVLLSDVVRFDRHRLGDVSGARAVHLQCHIGTDTLSLARLGSRVTGLDFSAEAVARARGLTARTGDRVDFVQADVYEAVEVLGEHGFDLVYTGIGALCWLPSIERWATTVAALLAPGGRLFLREAHPLLWSVDGTRTDELHLRFPYFEQEEPLEWSGDTSYVETERPLRATTTYEWNHGLGEIVTALLGEGLRLTMLIEHDSVPWLALPGQMVQRDDGEYALAATPAVAPLSYTLQAERPIA
ncbi:class I SAM-dependent methyltransferase [Rathayibacter tanaceti]|uniref:Bifunctional 3-demethylubiquinone-9 3-methyltransferase/ 2-octaprenyl-6-hydroxy phenol methylase n=2 Tax=Rathayibacter tanaceti TaxID=1671680 RepID=A0A166HKS1_9MICO|nr:class I SAM-dependent methyltransferase [Rathayibacter tanaceti]KZX20784.1 bifunctional 3-demethylubiquinone-9 3-methyltransferase/ 2-octaprenyl-6-hydroxy phenol methylase [Rathayibacter tanaceti]QHC56080.1 methyltransferase domain-containing protein [Rathayibacter tanaceti]TCO39062.1 methyltransferase family protein [Rathayibacter tanaceti]